MWTFRGFKGLSYAQRQSVHTRLYILYTNSYHHSLLVYEFTFLLIQWQITIRMVFYRTSLNDYQLLICHIFICMHQLSDLLYSIETEKTINSSCSTINECSGHLVCLSGLCQCPAQFYWNINTCIDSKYCSYNSFEHLYDLYLNISWIYLNIVFSIIYSN